MSLSVVAMPNGTPGWKLFTPDTARPGQVLHETYETRDAALNAACSHVQQVGRFPRTVWIEEPSGERISQREIEEYCRRRP
jgi:hypothetical protein